MTSNPWEPPLDVAELDAAEQRQIAAVLDSPDGLSVALEPAASRDTHHSDTQPTT